jgi:phosphoadenosine phosphosulfate reductase
MAELDLSSLQDRLEKKSTQHILRWVWETFGEKAAATSSFQSQSVPLLHIISETVPDLPVLFLDTGFHFPETLEFRDHIAEAFGLTVHSLEPRLGHDGFREQHGELHRRDPDLCCHLNKVQPLEDAFEDYDAWITGIRRDQTEARANTPVVQRQENGVLKVCPMVEWTSRDVWTYVNEHDLPSHPLLEEGYLSIGCAPCTQRPDAGEDARDGRWAQSEKTECGLHTNGAVNEDSGTSTTSKDSDESDGTESP